MTATTVLITLAQRDTERAFDELTKALSAQMLTTQEMPAFRNGLGCSHYGLGRLQERRQAFDKILDPASRPSGSRAC